MNDALREVLDAARGPLGPAVRPDFGSAEGPWGELRWMVARCNGFYLANAGVQVFRAGPGGLGPELGSWNRPDTWKDTYGRQAAGLFCFAQDLFGVQFAITGDRRVVAFEPETALRTVLGDSLGAWAQWLLDDPDVRTAGPLAVRWQDLRGPLGHHERLVPRRAFVLGGAYVVDNLRAADAAEAMRIRGPLARQLHRAQDGVPVTVHIG